MAHPLKPYQITDVVCRRIGEGVSLVHIAEATGIAVSTAHRKLRRRLGELTFDELVALAAWFDVPLSELIAEAEADAEKAS